MMKLAPLVLLCISLAAAQAPQACYCPGFEAHNDEWNKEKCDELGGALKDCDDYGSNLFCNAKGASKAFEAACTERGYGCIIFTC